MADAGEPQLDAYELVPPVEHFRLPRSGVNNRTLGVRTGAGEYVWKAYATSADPASIDYEHRLLTWLSGMDLPFGVPTPLRTRTGQTICALGAGWQALFARLPGAPPDAPNPAYAVALGEGLGQLHTALSHYPATARPGMASVGELRQIHPSVPNPFGLRPVDLDVPKAHYDTLLAWWRDELAALGAFVDGAYRALPWQAIHGDFLLANTLFAGERLTAVVDFEFAHPDVRVLDVASALHFGMRVLENPEPWEFTRSFCRGYGHVIRLGDSEVAAIPLLIRLRNADSVVWWTGRGLAAGDASPGLERMVLAQRVAGWLQIHEQQLLDLIVVEADV